MYYKYYISIVIDTFVKRSTLCWLRRNIGSAQGKRAALRWTWGRGATELGFSLAYGWACAAM